MKFYFDQIETQNLSHVPQILEVREFKQFKRFYNIGNAEFSFTTDYTECGIYLIEVSKLTHQWTSKNEFDSSFDTLENIPIHVVDAVKNKKLRIVIISIVEGDNFVKEYWDSFNSLTTSMRNLGLPPLSVLIVSGNVNADVEYIQWCEDNDQTPIIEFIGGTEGPDSLYDNNVISAKNAHQLSHPFLYSSLNRAHRHSRTEHLYVLAKENILDKGLVSGGIHFNEHIHLPKFQRVDLDEWNSTLVNNYPRSIDVDAETLRIQNQAHNVNFSIYNNSLLSVVTETYFEEPGLYFSEKTFRPIITGSPQIILGQPNALKYLKSKFNINLYFKGIDTNFDRIPDAKSRFKRFHRSLMQWITLDSLQRKTIYENLFGQLEQNLNTIRNTNFKKIIVDDIIKSTKNYFKGH